MADFFAKGKNPISGFGGDTTPYRIDFDVWNNYSEEQKTALKQQYKNIHIMNVPEATGYIDANLLVKLWENPSPTASFAAQNITLASDDYDMLLWLYLTTISDGLMVSTISPKGTGTMLTLGRTYDQGALCYQRAIRRTSDTSFSIDVATYGVSGSRAVENSVAVPIAIYGIKQSLSLKFQAIAHDVKASVDYSTDEYVIGTWIDGSTLYERTIYVSGLPNNTSVNIPHNISNVKLVVGYSGIGFNGSTSFVIPRAGVSYIDVSATETYLTIVDSGNYAGWSAYITLRYIKTS